MLVARDSFTKIQAMKLLTTTIVILLLAGCSKDNSNQLPSATRKDFFTTGQDTLHAVQAIVNGYGRGEHLKKIESISYIDSKNKSYAFVFYSSDKGISNVVIEQQYIGGKKTASQSIKCDGASCDCKVLTVIGDDGSVSVNCSCTSCSMIINQN